MFRKWLYCAFVFVLGGICFFSFRKEDQAQLTHFPVKKENDLEAPYFHVNIGEARYAMKLDLGAKVDFVMEDRLLKKLEPKTEIGETYRSGILGKQYRVKQYRLPKIQSGDLIFDSPIIEEENPEWKKDALYCKQDIFKRKDHGSIGWNLLGKYVLLLDYKHQKIALYDEITDLKAEGYHISDFINLPLLMDRGCLECEITLDGRKTRCVLDTGCYESVVHRPFEKGVLLEEIFFDSSWTTSFASFKIGKHDFGPMQFRQFPIQALFPIDVILGLDFFRDFSVVIDFPEKQVYFWRCDHPAHQ